MRLVGLAAAWLYYGPRPAIETACEQAAVPYPKFELSAARSIDADLKIRHPKSDNASPAMHRIRVAVNHR